MLDPFIGSLVAIALVSAIALLVIYIRTLLDHKKAQDMSLKDFFKAVETFAPIVLPFIPGVPAVLVPVIVHGMQVAESAGGTGAEKKAQAIDLVNTGIIGVNAAAGKQVVDPSVVNAVSNGIDTVVGVVNLVHNKPVAVDKDLVGGNGV